MAKRATDMHPHPFAAMIRSAWKASELTIEQVVFLYKTEAIRRGFEDTGNLKGHGAVKSWCYGWSIPRLDQYEVIESILNPRLRELGRTDALLPTLDARLGSAPDGLTKGGSLSNVADITPLIQASVAA